MRRFAIALSALLVSGCGLLGGTSRFTLRVEPPSGTRPGISLATVALEPGRSNLVAVGAYSVGRYDQEDLEVLRDSLIRSLEPFAAPGAHRLHVRVRNVLVSFSNSEGMVVAAVAWALVDPSGEIVFEEQFYASDYAKLNRTLGGLKDNVHEAIAGRILTVAVRAATRTGLDAIPPVERAHDSYESAVAALPAQIQATSVTILKLGGAYHMWTGPGAAGSSRLDLARSPEHFDWRAELAKAK